MTVSIVIPSSEADYGSALIMKEKLLGCNVGEVLIEMKGTFVEAKVRAARRAKYDELVFIDADVEDADKIDYSTLDSYKFDVGVPYFKVHPLDVGWGLLQNISAMTGLPFTVFGGWMYIRKRAWKEVGPFRTTMPMEDVDWGRRAFIMGYKLDVFPFTVYHPRPFKYEHAIGPLLTQEGVWGIPDLS